MPEESMTFEMIRNVQRQEQSDVKLSELPSNFYKRAEEYLKEKKKLFGKSGERSISIEIKNVERLLENIFNRRETKIINHAIISARTDIPPQNITEEEKKFFEIIVAEIKKWRKTGWRSLAKKT